ncbi:MAG: hypothetical protein POG24_09250, partial [Acidocella sp.]|nr:hypothetical protein [Acidocella sp.]
MTQADPSATLPQAARPARGGRAIFTIASANYLAYAATLMQSVRAQHPDIPRFVILADRPVALDGLDLAATLVECEALGVPMLGNLALWYSVLEFNTALKPFAFRHLIERHGFAELVYLDPDILLLAPLRTAFAALAHASLVLTPHRLAPAGAAARPSDHDILKAGAYNLGFCALRDDAPARRLLAWWAECCATHCRVAVADNLFTDQRW